MSSSLNPFNNLYRTEAISAEKFVELFSPNLLTESAVHRLFQPGNVLLTGLQGSGKSALLNLLKPEILVAFLESDEVWPLPDHCSKFISASITLRSSGALDFGQRAIDTNPDINRKVVGLHFADFLNYWILNDLFENLDLLSRSEGIGLRSFVGLNLAAEKLDEFAKLISKNRCWFGQLDNVSTFDDLKIKISQRIEGYESFLNYNSEFPIEFVKTKTIAGEPIGATADALRECKIVPPDIPLFVTIDQFEDLMDLEKEVTAASSPIFRSIIIRMLGNRDDRVSYRVGARPYSISEGLQGFGNNAFTEEMREYNVVNIDEVLSRHENRPSLFPSFCDDVLERRLREAGYNIKHSKRSLISKLFGGRVTAEDKVEEFIKKSRKNIISQSFEHTSEILDVLLEISETDPISAKMGEAWVRQNSNKLEITEHIVSSQPWSKRQWWKKERKQQAMLQVFSMCQQKMVWYGSADILSLSGRNILAFLSICQFIWAENLRVSQDNKLVIPSKIFPLTQSIGISSASEYWFRKIKAEPKGGDDRFNFVNVLANFLRDKLRRDLQMSYPGANGFSLSLNELKKYPEIEAFLSNCVAFGVLESFPHTPKIQSRGQSEKWYISSILTPHFQLPTAHTKEPYYASIEDVGKWMQKASVASHKIEMDVILKRKSRSKSPLQPNLFDLPTESNNDK